MAYVINVLLLVLMFSIGFLLGEKTFHKKSWSYDIILIFLVIVSTWIGVSTFIVHVGDVQLRMSQGLQMIFLGILVKRVTQLRRKSVEKANDLLDKKLKFMGSNEKLK